MPEATLAALGVWACTPGPIGTRRAIPRAAKIDTSHNVHVEALRVSSRPPRQMLRNTGNTFGESSMMRRVVLRIVYFWLRPRIFFEPQESRSLRVETMAHDGPDSALHGDRRSHRHTCRLSSPFCSSWPGALCSRDGSGQRHWFCGSLVIPLNFSYTTESGDREFNTGVTVQVTDERGTSLQQESVGMSSRRGTAWYEESQQRMLVS